MSPVLFHLGGYPVPGFGVAAVLGLAVALLIQRREGARLGYDPKEVDTLVLASVLCAWVGSRGTYILQNPDHPGALRDTGGFVFYGGVVAGVPCAWLLARRAGISGPRLLDIITPGMTLGLVLGRVGCTLAGCDYGRPAGAAAWWTLTFSDPACLVPPRYHGVPLLPSQPLMALELLVTFLVIYPLRIRLTPWPGAVLLAYLCVEPPLRFLVEYTRGDADRGFIGPFSSSQAFALVVTPLAAIGLKLLLSRPPAPVPEPWTGAPKAPAAG
jgi:phosphatidylglycerol:prolipoprotein diacylglycerol transferase